MASAVITIAVPGNAGATLRKLAQQINRAASVLPDVNTSGASVVCTINDTPGGGAIASVAVTGPYTSGTFYV
jgi:hypothetical protein